MCPASSAGEAIERMLVEKKISSKINYDVLRDLDKAWEQSNNTVVDSSGIEVKQNIMSGEPEAQLPSSVTSPQTCKSSLQATACSSHASLPLVIDRAPVSNRLPSLLSKKRPLSPSTLLTSKSEARYVQKLNCCICCHV